jgi:hypothetical protein
MARAHTPAQKCLTDLQLATAGFVPTASSLEPCIRDMLAHWTRTEDTNLKGMPVSFLAQTSYLEHPCTTQPALNLVSVHQLQQTST